MFEETLVAAADDESLQMIVKQAAPVVCAILNYVILSVLLCLSEWTIVIYVEIIEMNVWCTRNLSVSSNYL